MFHPKFVVFCLLSSEVDTSSLFPKAMKQIFNNKNISLQAEKSIQEDIQESKLYVEMVIETRTQKWLSRMRTSI